jgi:hypothetical protein
LNPDARAAAPLLEVRVGAARVFCTGRAQGNLGDHVGDDPDVVAANRSALAARTPVNDPSAWVWVQQVHGSAVHVATGPGSSPAPVADAVVTAVPGLALAVVTADCAPVVVASDNAVGVVHAGHRGLAAGVIEATIAALREIGTGDVRAFLAPCIRAEHYEFGAADLAPFVAEFGPTVEGRTSTGRPALDIPAAIRIVLEREGVVAFADCDRDTAGSDDYFSYRRRADSGRQATIAMLS